MTIRNVFTTLAAKAVVALALLSVAACGAGAQGNGGGAGPSARVAAFLGQDAVALIAAADRVEPFLLKAALAPDAKAGPGILAGYAWKARGADLAPGAVAEVKRLLLDDASYDFDVAKKCVMVPDYALRLHAGARHLDILVSFACSQWAIAGKGDSRVEDFDPVAGRLKAVVETVFRMD